MTRLIKKYKNRRLYDTESSQYITLEQLQQYVLDGIAFKIEDSETSQDLTNSILLQILVEMEAGSSQFLSSDVLRQIICWAHHPMHDSLKAMLEQLFRVDNNPYQKIGETWNQHMQETMDYWHHLFNPRSKK